MLNKAHNWYRTTTIKNNDERLGQRRKAAEAMVAAWEKATPLAIVDVVCLGLEVMAGKPSDSNGALPFVLDTMGSHQPSFDRSGGATSLDSRLCVLMALGELIHRRSAGDAKLKRKDPVVVAAQALTAGLRFGKPAVGAFLHGMLTELGDDAEGVLEKIDIGRRTRRADPAATLEKVVVSDQDGLLAIRKGVQTAMQAMMNDAVLDREELQALWWVTGGYSTTERRLYADLPACSAALLAGSELAGLVAWPGTRGMGALAARVASAAAGDNEKKLPNFLSDIPKSVWAACLRPGVAAVLPGRELVFPVLTAAADGKHKLPPNALIAMDIRKTELAIQVFSEQCLATALAA